MIHVINYPPEKIVFQKKYFCALVLYFALHKVKDCSNILKESSHTSVGSLRVLSEIKNSAECEKKFLFLYENGIHRNLCIKKGNVVHDFRWRLELREFGIVISSSSSEIFHKTFS